MPIPSTFADLSITAGANSPAGSESPATTDDYLRVLSAFLKSIQSNTGNGWASPYAALDGSGNLGIGGTPAARLHVSGSSPTEARLETTGDLTGTASANYTIRGSNGASASVGFSGSPFLNIVQSLNSSIRFFTNNTEKLQLTADGRLYGKSLHDNAGDLSGATNQYIASGTYTPTVTAVTNVDSVSAAVVRWMRVGNCVTVFGSVTVDPTAASTLTIFRMSLPIASNLTVNADCAGTATATNSGQTGAWVIQGEPVNDVALFSTSLVPSASSHGLSFIFGYQVI